jgi:hypothetical protein
MIASLRHFLRNLLRRNRVERELADEIEESVEQLIEENVLQGMSRDDATRAARLAMGGVDQVKDHVRDVRVGAWLDALRQDLRFGVRTFMRRPGFTAIAMLTLGVGIGATTAIFSLIDSVLLKPLPVPRTRAIDDGVGGAASLQSAANRGGADELPRLAAAGAGVREPGRIRQRICQPHRHGRAGTAGRGPGHAELVPDAACRPARRPVVRGARGRPRAVQRHDSELRAVAAPLRRRSRHRRPDDSPGWRALPGGRRHASRLSVSAPGRPPLDAGRLSRLGRTGARHVLRVCRGPFETECVRGASQRRTWSRQPKAGADLPRKRRCLGLCRPASAGSRSQRADVVPAPAGRGSPGAGDRQCERGGLARRPRRRTRS